MKGKFRSILLATLALCSVVAAVVNPSLQPGDLNDRYRAVVAATVTAVGDGAVHLKVTQVLQGEFASTNIAMQFAIPDEQDDADPDPDAPSHTPADLKPGDQIAAWVGGKTRGESRSVLMYVGNRHWHIAELQEQDSAQWKWKSAAPEMMAGTFNGQTARLIEMLVDARDRKHFFPAEVFARFKPDRVLATFNGAIAGVAVYDLDDDGRLDVVATSTSGVRVLLQRRAGEFEDATSELGLANVSASSVSIARLRGELRPVLLLDSAMYVNNSGQYERSANLPAGPDRSVKVAAFADLNADGHADVLVSHQGGGLRAYLHPGEGGGAFVDATTRLGLDEVAPAGDGWITVGDWNLDGRVDLFYAVDEGVLLVQDAEGRFQSTPLPLSMDFRGGRPRRAAFSGAGVFAPLWRDNQMDLLIPDEVGQILLARDGAAAVNVSGYGNEIALATVSQVAAIADDFDMDGRVDLLTISGSAQTRNSYHINRGYGSFMHAELYQADFWPGESYQRGAGGAAVGDLTGDGANDLLIGGLDGRLVLVESDALRHRTVTAHPRHHERVLQQTAIARVRVQGDVGVTGARVELVDLAGERAAIRAIGQMVATGCRGPDETNIAVRTPGEYELRVTFSDGHLVAKPLTLKPAEIVLIDVRRE